MRWHRMRLLTFPLAALLILLVACGEDDLGGDPATATPEPTPSVDLSGTEWVLTEIDGAPASGETRVTLEFNDQAGGYSGCNWYGSDYTISGDTISFETPTSTMRLCIPQEIVDQEMRFQQLLVEVERFEATESELRLLTADGTAALVFERREIADVDPTDLIGTTWLLESVDGVEHIGPPALLTFDDASSFSTRDGCYDIEGTYQASGDRLSFPSSAVRSHACLQPAEWHSHEASLSQAIGDVAYFRFQDDGNTLELIHYDGRTAVFTRATDLPADDAWAVTWTLDSIVTDGKEEELIPGTEITLVIPDPAVRLEESQRVTGSSGCNTYQALMKIGVESLTFDEIIVTEMACMEPAGVMDQEQRYLNLLSDVTTHEAWDEGTLRLITADGTALVFRVS